MVEFLGCFFIDFGILLDSLGSLNLFGYDNEGSIEMFVKEFVGNFDINFGINGIYVGIV